MPSVPTQTKCSTLGCKNDRSKKNSFCLEHGGYDVYKGKKSDKRADFNAMYDKIGWKRIRTAQLSRQPLCQACFMDKRFVAASVVDHLFSWSHIGKEAFYNNIFQSLCASHHSDKTNLEHKGIYRRYHNGAHTDYALHAYQYLVTATQGDIGQDGQA